MTLEGGKVSIDLRPVQSLIPHEEVIESRVTEMALRLRKDAVQKDPLLVDRETGVVLDGMHRLEAFQRLGIEQAVCCEVDYGSQDVSLRRWARVFKTARTGAPEGPMRELGFFASGNQTGILPKLETREISVAALSPSRSFLPSESKGIQQAFDMVRKVDKLAEHLGWERSFVPDDELDVPLRDGTSIVVLVQRLDKQDVLTSARTAKLFPCKTSMHIVDPRPVGLGVQLSELTGGSKRAIEERLAARPFKMLPRNSTYEGRRYKERLMLFGHQ